MKIRSLFFPVLSLLVLLIFTGCQLDTAAERQQDHRNLSPSAQIPATKPSCIQPTPTEVQACRDLEQQVLASTVRIHMVGLNESDEMNEPISLEGISHGTIVGGRYLVTHNHFRALPIYQGDTSVKATLCDTKGRPIVVAKRFTVVFEDEETLVLEFTGYGGVGLFEELALPSAEIQSWATLPLAIGMEVAQIDWDGATTAVEWVKIEALIFADGTPRLELAGDITPGSSGGGVFWNGYHIGNNWSNSQQNDISNGKLLRAYSTVALNSQPIATASPPL